MHPETSRLTLVQLFRAVHILGHAWMLLCTPCVIYVALLGTRACLSTGTLGAHTLFSPGRCIQLQLLSQQHPSSDLHLHLFFDDVNCAEPAPHDSHCSEAPHIPQVNKPHSTPKGQISDELQGPVLVGYDPCRRVRGSMDNCRIFVHDDFHHRGGRGAGKLRYLYGSGQSLPGICVPDHCGMLLSRTAGECCRADRKSSHSAPPS
jgi:hypothetical protein